MKDSFLVSLAIFLCVWWMDYRAEQKEKRDNPNGERHYNVAGADKK